MERVGDLRVQLWEEEHRIMWIEWLKVEMNCWLVDGVEL